MPTGGRSRSPRPTPWGRVHTVLRSQSAAAAFIGAGWTTRNFACSGATQPNGQATDKAYVGSASGQPEFNYGKPGITFGTFNVKAPYPKGFGTLKGQAQLLEDYAKSNDDISVVALSIGGNDFGFGKIGKACITDGSLGGKCRRTRRSSRMSPPAFRWPQKPSGSRWRTSSRR